MRALPASWLPLVLVAVALLCRPQPSTSQMGMPKKEKILHNKSDLKYIKCQVCEEVAKVVHRTVADMRKGLAPGKKLKEIDIIEKIEKICDPEAEEGLWISRYDLVEEDRQLKVVEMDGHGKCKVECQTIARSCKDALGDHDTDVAEELFKGTMNRAKLAQLLCYDLSESCSSKPPKLPEGGRKHDEEWVEEDPKALEVQKMMRDMQAAGMPGMSMYGRDELMDQMQNMYGDEYGEGPGDEYGDDAYEDAVPPEGSATPESDIIGSVTKTVTDTISAAVDGAKKVVGKVSSLISGSGAEDEL